jgi:hypothetical protein
MWIESAAWTRVRGRSVVVHGAALGRAPEPGTALLLQPAFGRALRAHAASVVMSARGAPHPALGIGLADLPDIEGPCFRGAIVHEEGVLLRVFSARIDGQRPRLYDAVRIELSGDTAWGLISMTLGIVTVAVVGGGLPLGASLWDCLRRLLPQTAEPIERDALAPLVIGDEMPGGLWAMPAVKHYDRGASSAVVLRSAGPASEGVAVARVGLGWRPAYLLEQQPGGLIQVDFAGGQGIVVDCIAARVRLFEEETWQSRSSRAS